MFMKEKDIKEQVVEPCPESDSGPTATVAKWINGTMFVFMGSYKDLLQSMDFYKKHSIDTEPAEDVARKLGIEILLIGVSMWDVINEDRRPLTGKALEERFEELKAGTYVRKGMDI